jgi:hypothetical protein
MKYLIALLVSGNLYALPQTKRVNAAIDNIPMAFSTAVGSLVLSEAKYPKTLILMNDTSTEVEVNCSNVNGVPTASEGTALFVPASTKLIIDMPSIKGDCYVRSLGAAITTGIFTATIIE